MMVSIAKNRKSRLVPVNERGLVIGQDHHRAKLTDHEVELMHRLRGSGMSIGNVAKVMEVPKSTAQKVLDGTRRSQFASRFKAVPVKG